MKRSVWKGNYIYSKILTNEFLNKKNKYIWARSSTIPEKLVGETVFIYNGKNFVKSYITREKVGLKFGEFAYTRRFTRKDNRIKNKKK